MIGRLIASGKVSLITVRSNVSHCFLNSPNGLTEIDVTLFTLLNSARL